MPDQPEDSVDEDIESEQADLESCLSDEDEDEPIDQPATEPVDKPSSESSPTTHHHYPLRNRDGRVQPPNRFM